MGPDLERGWLAAARDGDRDAFGKLVDRYHRLVWEALWRICDEPGDAEDAYQETFLATWRNLARFDPERGSFGTWLYTIATRTALSGKRSRTRRRRREERASVPERDTSPPPDAAADRDETAEAVRAAIARLPERQRAVLVLRHYQGLSVEETAEALGTRPGTVKSQFHDAVGKLREALRPLLSFLL